MARGTFVFLRGQIGQNLDTSESGSASATWRDRTEQAMKNIDMLLKEAGSQLDHICKLTIYISDPRYREDVYRVVGRWLKGVFPVSTGHRGQRFRAPGIPGGGGRDRGYPLIDF